MKRIALLVLAMGLLAYLTGCAATDQALQAEIDAAKQAIEDAQDADAPDLCPDEFQSAELKLRQAELLAEDDQGDEAMLVAQQTVNLAELAIKCAEARKTSAGDLIVEAGPPAELKNFKTSVFFNFNSNAIRPAERAKLDKAAAFLKKWSKQHNFYILISAHADLPGSPADNTELAKRRALVTRYYLGTQGIPRNRIYMHALGNQVARRELGTESRSKKDPAWRRVDVTILFEKPLPSLQPESNLFTQGVE